MNRWSCFVAAATALAAVATVGVGCTARDQRTYEQYCAEYQIDCDEIVRRWPGAPSGSQTPLDADVSQEREVLAQPLQRSELPSQLQAWAQSQQGREVAAHQVWTDDDGTYVAISGDLQRTGGYRIEVDKAQQQDGEWLIQARLIPPPPGTMVTMALTNPMGFFRLPRLEGPVRIVLDGRGLTTEER